MTTALAFLVVFGAIVFVHELGHFTAAKAAGIQVYEFSLGFGPALVHFLRNDTKYSIRLFPLGGFVKMAGMDEPEEEADSIAADDPRSFNNQALWVRMGTILAGPGMNFVFAVVLFAAYFVLMVLPPTITMVEEGSPAYQAGLQPGDQFVTLDGREVHSTDEVVGQIQEFGGRVLTVEVLRETERLQVDVVPEGEPGAGRLGIGVDAKPRLPVGQSIWLGVQQTVWMTQELIRLVMDMLRGEIEPEIAGPIGIVQIVGETAGQGAMHLVILAAILNVNLGILNLLPVPILDGGWIVLLGIEGIRGRPIAPEYRGLAQLIGLALLILLMVFATFQDLTRLDWFS